MIYKHPESKEKLITLASNVIKVAGAEGVLPTPLDDLIEASKIKCTDDLLSFKESFISKFPKIAQEIFNSGIQKVKGVADLRERAICIPSYLSGKKVLFPKAHELGHQIIPWHNINGQGYVDNQLTLSRDVENGFDLEANFFAQEVIFPTKLFRSDARDFKASFDAIIMLSDRYGATIQSTMWKYIEEQDEKILLVPYYPTKSNNSILKRWTSVASANFKKKYPDIELPMTIASGHPWFAAKEIGMQCSGADKLNCNGSHTPFEWMAFWNKYTLFVMIRETPTLGVIGRIFS